MARALTIRELIQELEQLDPDAIPVICHDGKGHYNYITKTDIIEDVDPYFPGPEPENVEYDDDGEFGDEVVTMFVQIGSIW